MSGLGPLSEPRSQAGKVLFGCTAWQCNTRPFPATVALASNPGRDWAPREIRMYVNRSLRDASHGHGASALSVKSTRKLKGPGHSGLV